MVMHLLRWGPVRWTQIPDTPQAFNNKHDGKSSTGAWKRDPTPIHEAEGIPRPGNEAGRDEPDWPVNCVRDEADSGTECRDRLDTSKKQNCDKLPNDRNTERPAGRVAQVSSNNNLATKEKFVVHMEGKPQVPWNRTNETYSERKQTD